MGDWMKTTSEKCLEITSLFEAEVFVWLMLEALDHPLAGDNDFVNGLLEDASEALRMAAAGEPLIEGVPPASLNFVAAVWYAENCALDNGATKPETIEARKAWLLKVRQKWPSCFCDPADLHQG
jgi:hypothetical protein